jgi:hypothetical protein
MPEPTANLSADEDAERGARALDAVALHRPTWLDKYAYETTDPAKATSGRCNACNINTTPAGCQTWQIANPITSSTAS